MRNRKAGIDYRTGDDVVRRYRMPTVSLSEEERGKLTAIARERGWTLAQVIRSLINEAGVES